MGQFERYFTIEEARAELPWLRDALTRLHEELTRLKEAHDAAVPSIPNGNGSASKPQQYFLQQNTVAAIIEEISRRGIQIKDPWRGLVDFPNLREGREVLLCWQLGENDIKYWHDLESGFPGRTPL